MRLVKWFVAGALAVPLGHQLMLGLLLAIGLTDRKPFPMDATAPFGVPQLISLTFWGGLWGVLLGLFLEKALSGRWFWAGAAIFGAIAPTLVAGFVVAPLKGMAAGGNAKLAVFGLLVNLAWGVMTAVLFRLLASRTSSR